MASDNRAYTQFEDTHTPAHYGASAAPAGGKILTNEESKTLKTWKNSRRLCWALLVLGIITLLLQIIGAGISGVYVGLEFLMARFIAGVWLATLGVVGAVLGLRAFKNTYDSSKCWTMSHFVMCILATIAYIILFLMAIADIIGTKSAIYSYTDYEEAIEEEEVSVQNATISANGTTVAITTMPSTTEDPMPIFRTLKGDLTISVILLGTTLAFTVLSIIANIIICRHWCKGGAKTMTIVYMPQDASGNAQTQSIVVPSKTQVVVIPTPKADPNQMHPTKFA